ncbi:MAG: hypothetical protein ACXVEU_09905 [Nocardioidaceae bacterium]
MTKQTPTARQRCRQLYAAQAQPRRAAAVSLSQWEVHVGAMNKLVTGALTLRQANAFWNSTRVGASHRLARYDAAVARLRRTHASCPRQPDTASAGLMTCQAAVDARKAELRKADIAIETWRHHVRDMEMFRMGKMTPAQATHMWLRNWHRGVTQLNAYRVARKHAAGQHC